jgi:hypothetical protein
MLLDAIDSESVADVQIPAAGLLLRDSVRAAPIAP